MEFVVDHKNITGTISFHTMSGVLLRGFNDHPDDDQNTEDMWTAKKIGAKGTELGDMIISAIKPYADIMGFTGATSGVVRPSSQVHAR